MTTAYAKRETVFETGEHQWRVEPDALVWTRPSGESLTVLWRDVTAVRAAFAPSKWKSWRYLIEIHTRQGRQLTIDNGHFKGVGDFEDRSAAFTPFALACVERIAALSPGARGWLGASPGGYLGQLVFFLLCMAFMLLVLFLLPTPLGVLVLVKLLLILVSLPLVVVWAIRARPRRVPLTREAFAAGLPKAD